MKHKSLLDPAFRYTSSVDTDIRKTFAKERKRLAKERQQQAQVVSLDTKIRRK